MNCVVNQVDFAPCVLNQEKLPEQCSQFQSMTESELVLACQGGQSGAFEQLLKQHERTIRHILYSLAPDFTDTADIFQEAYIRIWRSMPSLRNPAAFRGWLNQIVTHLLYDELKKRPKQYKLISMDEPLGPDSTDNITRDIQDCSPQPEETALSKELSGVLVEALKTIPKHSRTAVILRDVEGLTYEEIARLTRTELGTVKSRIARARCKMQRLVVPYLKASA